VYSGFLLLERIVEEGVEEGAILYFESNLSSCKKKVIKTIGIMMWLKF